MSSKKIYRTVLAAMFLSLAFVLPMLTGQIREIGNKLCPMHIPVLLCGFFCGPAYAAIVGFVAPLLRSLIFGMPQLMPRGIAMALELMTYGIMSGLMYKILPKKKAYIYVSLVVSMIAGRIVWGGTMAVLYGLGKTEFGFPAFVSGAILNTVPGMIIQMVLIPIIVISLGKYTVKE